MRAVDNALVSNLLKVALQRLPVIHNLHGSPTQHEAWANQHRIPDARCHIERSSQICGNSVCRRNQPTLVKHLLELPALFGPIEVFGGGAQNPHSIGLKVIGKTERGLPTKLHQHPEQFSRLRFRVNDLEDIFKGQWLKVQAICGVVVG